MGPQAGFRAANVEKSLPRKVVTLSGPLVIQQPLKRNVHKPIFVRALR